MLRHPSKGIPLWIIITKRNKGMFKFPFIPDVLMEYLIKFIIIEYIDIKLLVRDKYVYK